LTAEPTLHPRPRDAGFTLLETVIVVMIIGIIVPVLAFSFSVVVRTTPSAEDRADDARSLLNLTTHLSQDVSSTREDGFFVAPEVSPGGCDPTSLPASSINLLELQWTEDAARYVVNYRWLNTGPGKGQIHRFACLQGQAARQARMTPDLNEVPTGMFAPAPVEITKSPTTMIDGTAANKGIQFVVLIFDDFGIQRELLSLDATTTNVLTTLPGASGTSSGSNTAPVAPPLQVTITPPATRIETLPAYDPDAGDVLFTTFPDGLPGTWDIRAAGVNLEITPDPAAAPGDYPILYRVTDPYGASTDGQLLVTIAAPGANQPPVANSASIRASRGVEAVATLTFSDPDLPTGFVMAPVLDPATIPPGWSATVTGNEVRITPSTTASGTRVIRYQVTDDVGQTAISQITVNVCTVSLVSISPTTVAIRSNGDLADAVKVGISSNGACDPLVVGFLPNSDLVVEVTENFNASNVVTIRKNNPYAWTRPVAGTPRVVPLNVRQGANGEIELTVNLETIAGDS
jgi:prepilin-type N-terminal cleavage/methylation domain-containing protein